MDSTAHSVSTIALAVVQQWATSNWPHSSSTHVNGHMADGGFAMAVD